MLPPGGAALKDRGTGKGDYCITASKIYGRINKLYFKCAGKSSWRCGAFFSGF